MLVLGVDDRSLLVLVSLAVAVDAHPDSSQLVFENQVDPFIELHARLRLHESRPVR